MSSSPPCTRNAGRVSYSTWPMSGACFALSWLKKFWYVPLLPFATMETLTWMSGLALFQMATTLSMLGTQVVKSSVTLPLDGLQLAEAESEPLPEPLPPLLQPARATVAATARAATLRNFVVFMLFPFGM